MGELFETEDIGLAEHVLSGVYGTMRISARSQRRGIRLTRTLLTPAARLDQVSFAMGIEVAAVPLGALAFIDLRSGRVRHSSNHEDRYYRSGQLYLAGQPEHPYTATIHDAVAEMVIIDPALPAQLADTPPSGPPQLVRFTGYESISPQRPGSGASPATTSATRCSPAPPWPSR